MNRRFNQNKSGSNLGKSATSPTSCIRNVSLLLIKVGEEARLALFLSKEKEPLREDVFILVILSVSREVVDRLWVRSRVIKSLRLRRGKSLKVTKEA